MPRLSRSTITLTTIALAAAGVTLGAGPASAALTTYCDGDAADVTVPGDLVVAEGVSCVLDGVTVAGTTHIESGADLVVEDSTFRDDVTVGSDGYFDAGASHLDKALTSTAAYGVYLDDSEVGGAYRSDGTAKNAPFLYSYDTTFSSTVDVDGGVVSLETAQVSGDLTTNGTVYTDVIDSTLASGLNVTGSQEGTAICAGEIDGDAHFADNSTVQIGTGLDLVDCSGTNYFGADLVIENSTGAVDVTDNIIRGDLRGEGNTVAPTGSDNRVRGESAGQFTELEPAARTVSAQSSSTGHADALRELREERRSAAEAAAELAGPTSLR